MMNTSSKFTRLFLALLFAELACASASCLAEDEGHSFVTSGTRHGIFSGGFNPSAAGQFEAWLGRRSDFNVEFLTDTAFADYTDNGKKITDAMSHSGWLIGTWAQTHRPDRNMLFSIPLSTKQDVSLAHVANGNYDVVYAGIARSIAASYPHAVIRIGWEFNGDWYPWSAKGHEKDYIDAFRHVAAIFKNASSGFTIDWCPTHGFSAKMAAEKAYPGDDVVDVIGMDFYNDYRWGNFQEDPEKRWDWYRTFDHGLEWQAHFAEVHKKRMSLPEWGVNRDDSLFIQKMHSWITSHNYAYEAYWDSNSAFSGMLSRGQYPAAANVYRQLFGSQADPK